MNSPTVAGLLIAFIGGVALSFDIPIIRLAVSDPWLVMVLRGGGIALMLALVWRFLPDLTGTSRLPFADVDWMTVAILQGVTNIIFTVAIFLTPTANIVFILAFNPLIAALLAWWLIGERPSLMTWMAIAVTIAGVTLIVGDGLGQGNTLGDLGALACAAIIAYTLVLTRRSGKDMSLAPGFGGLISAVFGLPMAIAYSGMPEQIGWLFFNGLLVMPLAASFLALAPKYISAPQVGMFFLLETVLAPIWVWWLFGEIPTQNTLIGGLMIFGAIAVHSFSQLIATQRVIKAL